MYGNRKRRDAGHSPDRWAVARLLADRQPIPGDEAAVALGWTVERWWDAVSRYAEWFDFTGKGWILTEEGRAAVVEEGSRAAAVEEVAAA